MSASVTVDPRLNLPGEPLNNLTATDYPTSSDDEAAGYGDRSLWRMPDWFPDGTPDEWEHCGSGLWFPRRPVVCLGHDHADVDLADSSGAETQMAAFTIPPLRKLDWLEGVYKYGADGMTNGVKMVPYLGTVAAGFQSLGYHKPTNENGTHKFIISNQNSTGAQIGDISTLAGEGVGGFISYDTSTIGHNIGTVDTSAETTLKLTFQWGATGVGQTVTLKDIFVELHRGPF